MIARVVCLLILFILRIGALIGLVHGDGRSAPNRESPQRRPCGVYDIEAWCAKSHCCVTVACPCGGGVELDAAEDLLQFEPAATSD